MTANLRFNRFTIALLAIVAGVVACRLDESTARAQRGAVDLTYVHADAVAAAVIHPQRVLKSPEYQFLPIEVLSAFGKRDFGIDPVDIEQVVVVAEPPAGDAAPGYGIVIRLARAYQRDQIAPELLSKYEPATEGDRQFLRAPDPMLPCVFLPDDRTIVAATESTLLKMTAGRHADSHLRQMLRQAGTEHDAIALVSIEAVRDQLNALLANLPELPGPLAGVAAVPDQLSSIRMRMSFGQDYESVIALHATDADAAEELETLIRQSLQLGERLTLARMTSELPDSEDPVDQAGKEYMQRIVGILFDAVMPQREDERLVVNLGTSANVANIGILTALLLPAVQSAREAARRAQAANDLKQIALAMHNYHDTYRKLPDVASLDEDGNKLLSWRVHLLPFLEENELYNQFKLDEPWDSEHNMRLVQKIPQAYQNPNRPAVDGMTNYLLPVGEGTMFSGTEGPKFASIIDGTSQTIMVLEVDADQAVFWTKPEDLAYDATQPMNGLGNHRPGGFQAALGDGSVRFINNDVGEDILRAAFSSDGREPNVNLDN